MLMLRLATAGPHNASTVAPAVFPVIGIVDVSPYMGRIVAAAVVVRIILVHAARSYGQVYPDAADRAFGPQPTAASGTTGGTMKGLPARLGINRCRNGEEAGR
jgi:hypothetical protein